MATKAKGKPKTSATRSESFRTPPIYTCAMDKLRDEMAKSKQRYVQVVGEYLTDYLQQHPEAEEKLMAAGKSIEGSLGAMKDEARKHEQSGVGILDDATAFGVVLRYFGIEGTPAPASAPAQSVGTPYMASARRGADAAPAPAPDDAAAQSVGTPYMASARRGADAAPAPTPDPFDLDALMGGL